MDQLELNFEPGLTRKHRDLLACVAARVHWYGLDNAASDMDMAPSNLATACGGGNRKIGLQELERYLERSEDFTPIYYLIEKFLMTSAPDKDRVLRDVQAQLTSLQKTLMELKGT